MDDHTIVTLVLQSTIGGEGVGTVNAVAGGSSVGASIRRLLIELGQGFGAHIGFARFDNQYAAFD